MSRSVLWGVAGLSALTAFYLAFPDRLYVFDGVMFAGVIERGVDDWHAQLFNRRHLLFNPLMMAARDVLLKLGLSLSGYDVMQRVNAVAGALGIGLFFAIVKKLTRDGAVALLAALLLAVTATYWSRAVEGQVYMLMTLGALGSLWAILWLLESPGPWSAAVTIASIGAAALVHIADVVLFVAAAAAVLFVGRRAACWVAGFSIFMSAVMSVAYAAAFRLRSAADLLSFFLTATEYFSQGRKTSVGGLIWRFFHSNGLAPLDRATIGLDDAFSSVIFHVGRPWAPLGGIVLSAGIFLTARAVLKDKASRPAAAVLLFAGLGFVAVNTFWLGGLFFWAAPLAAFIALASIPAAWRLKDLAPKQRRAAAGIFASGVAALGAWNFWFGIGPQGRIENNAGYRAANFVAQHTVPSSWIVISGFGAFPNSKVYLPYFSHRNRQVLEYFFDRNSKSAALAQFRKFLSQNMSAGAPIYVLSDLEEDPEINRQLMARWGLSVDEVRGCFGPGSVLPIARSSEGLGIYLFEPKGRLPLLFSGLGYSALTDDEKDRLAETVTELKIIASNMTSIERRQAGEMLRTSDYGAGLIYRNFSRYIDPETQRVVRRRLDLFHQYQKSSVFHLRLSGLYQFLGLVADQRREWAEAARLSKGIEPHSGG